MRCVVLVGLPGAGKSTVGPLLAARLGGWRFVDLDLEIERATGRSIGQIFASDGEAAFRRLEREATQRLASGLVASAGARGPAVEPRVADAGARGPTGESRVADAGARAPGVVLAPGGGWILDPANLKALGPATATVYLRVSPTVALRRMAGAAAARPLLATSDPLTSLNSLLEAREAAYLQANHTVAAELMSPVAVADSIVALVSRGQGH